MFFPNKQAVSIKRKLEEARERERERERVCVCMAAKILVHL